MCGITGFLSQQPEHTDASLRHSVQRMTDALAHRGPDDDGVFVDPVHGLALGHRRLAILDLSPSGRQPMTSADGRFTIVFNGEIYNHQELRPRLQEAGVEFRGHSDTETLVNLIAVQGLEKALEQLNGMFAFAVWDAQERKLSLARDRMGIKPLYFAWRQGTLYFASELKALKALPNFHTTIDRAAVGELLQHCYIPAPRSIYQSVFKLPPGFQLTVQANTDHALTPAKAWYPGGAKAVSGMRSPFPGSEQDATDELERLLSDSVSLRCLSDVPLGAFLSGGIDSSLVVALMQAQSSRAVKTFTIGFSEDDYNEAHHAAAIAKHLGTDHTEYIVTPQEAMNVIADLPRMFDEPFADSSQIPTFLVCRLARQQVKVVLSGDGGDEFFGGYNRYHHINGIWNKTRRVPSVFRSMAARCLPALQKMRGRASSGLWKGVLRARTIGELYCFLNRHWKFPELVVRDFPHSELQRHWPSHVEDRQAIEQMMVCDSMNYLPNDILTKVDRTSMFTSLEARVPLLDHRVTEFAWRMPAAAKFASADDSKIPLRNILAKYVPRPLFERPKTGFGIPIDHWLRGPLRDWADDLLSTDRLNRGEIFFAEPIREKWEQHLAGTHDWHYLLWDVLMFQAWLDAA